VRWRIEGFYDQEWISLDYVAQRSEAYRVRKRLERTYNIPVRVVSNT